MNYRLVICIDVDARCLEEAYGRVHKGMTAVNFEGFEGWESSDENFDNDGEPVTPEVMQQARGKFFKRTENEQGNATE